jgi:aspartate-semialdehyde dehydrogenase
MARSYIDGAGEEEKVVRETGKILGCAVDGRVMAASSR